MDNQASRRRRRPGRARTAAADGADEAPLLNPIQQAAYSAAIFGPSSSD